MAALFIFFTLRHVLGGGGGNHGMTNPTLCLLKRVIRNEYMESYTLPSLVTSNIWILVYNFDCMSMKRTKCFEVISVLYTIATDHSYDNKIYFIIIDIENGAFFCVFPSTLYLMYLKTYSCVNKVIRRHLTGHSNVFGSLICGEWANFIIV